MIKTLDKKGYIMGYILPLVLSRKEAQELRQILKAEGIHPDDGPVVNKWILAQILDGGEL